VTAALRYVRDLLLFALGLCAVWVILFVASVAIGLGA